jgi:hypothetical protein
MSPNTVLRTVAGTSTRATVDRIVRTYAMADEAARAAGREWYGASESIVDSLAARTGHSRETVAAVIAHLSPRTTWGRNVYGATMLLTEGIAPTCIGANVDRARKAMASPDPLSTFGPDAHKTRRFAANLLGRRDVVTVDVWATRVALGDRASESTLSRVGVYDAIERAYVIAGARLGVDPVTVQATTWIVARNGRAA